MKLSSYTVDPTAAYGWKPTVQALADFVLDVPNESADAFAPLKTVMGYLSVIVKNDEVRYAYFVKPFTPLTFESANEGQS